MSELCTIDNGVHYDDHNQVKSYMQKVQHNNEDMMKLSGDKATKLTSELIISDET